MFWVFAPWGWVFASRHFEGSYVPRPTLGPIQPPIQWAQGLFPGGVKRLGRGFDHPLPFSAEVKERVQLYQTPGTFVAGSRVTIIIIIVIIIINV